MMMGKSSDGPDEKLRVIATPGSPQLQAIATTSSASQDPVDKYASFIVRGAIVAVSAAGVFMFARSIRLFTQFEHARQVPSDFIQKQFRLRGSIASVANDGSLRVIHRPIYRFPRISSLIGLSRNDSDPGRLTLKLAGIEVSEAGNQWLRQNLGSLSTGNGKKVWFTLIKRPPSQDSLDCEIVAKLGRLPFHTSLNQELIRRGLARVPGSEVPDHFESLRSVPAYSRLVNQLLISEQIADRRGVGMWQRETWVEAVSAYPSQVRDIVRHSTPVRFAGLLAQGTKEVLVTSYNTGKTVASVTLSVGKKAVDIGQKSVNFVQGVYGKISGFVKK